MKKPLALLAGLFLLAILGTLLWLGHSSDAASLPATTQPASVNLQGAEQANGSLASKPADAVPPPEPSPPASFEVGADGHLKISQSLRQIFDFFLGTASSSGETPVALTHRYIQEHLHEPAASEATRIFDNYVAYLKATEEQQLDHSASAAPANAGLVSGVKMQQQEALQARYLTPDVAQAFYGDENAIARYHLARQQIEQMNGLGKEQKDEQLAVLMQQLPPSAQKTLQDSDADATGQQ